MRSAWALMLMLAMVAALPSAQGAAGDAAFPNKPIRVIVPFPAGSATDILTRVVGQKLVQPLGQNIIVDNRGGGSGSIGALAAARATPDGHTLILGGLSMLVVAPALNSAVGYTTQDFAPVSNVATAPYILAVHAQVPATSVKELIALARSKPGQLSYASAGSGSLAHLAGELFSRTAAINLTHVPYKTSAQSVVDVANGRIDVLFGTLSPILPFIQSGRLRVLGVTGKSRLPALPDAPPIAEAGLPGYNVIYWLGMLAPAATPSAIIARLNRDLVTILGTAEMRETLSAQGLEATPTTPQAFSGLLREDAVKWRNVIKVAGIRGE